METGNYSVFSFQMATTRHSVLVEKFWFNHYSLDLSQTLVLSC